jgi:hypothetical protein
VACTAVFLAVSVSFFPRGTLATVEEQRARLPPPAACTDKVEGTWLGLKYEPQYREWYEYTLVIRRSEPRDRPDGSGPLVGEMTSHYWYGNEHDEKPPPCGPGRNEVFIKMPGKGAVEPDGRIAFGASSYTLDKVVCGRSVSYNPDNFSGKIETERQEFQSVNNDGGRAVNSPTVFRRVRCADAAHRTTAKATPPAFAPPKRKSWGCGR